MSWLQQRFHMESLKKKLEAPIPAIKRVHFHPDICSGMETEFQPRGSDGAPAVKRSKRKNTKYNRLDKCPLCPKTRKEHKTNYSGGKSFAMSWGAHIRHCRERVGAGADAIVAAAVAKALTTETAEPKPKGKPGVNRAVKSKSAPKTGKSKGSSDGDLPMAVAEPAPLREGSFTMVAVPEPVPLPPGAENLPREVKGLVHTWADTIPEGEHRAVAGSSMARGLEKSVSGSPVKPKKPRTKKAPAPDSGSDTELESDTEEAESPKASSKKRKAPEEETTPVAEEKEPKRPKFSKDALEFLLASVSSHVDAKAALHDMELQKGAVAKQAFDTAVNNHTIVIKDAESVSAGYDEWKAKQVKESDQWIKKMKDSAAAIGDAITLRSAATETLKVVTASLTKARAAWDKAVEMAAECRAQQ